MSPTKVVVWNMPPADLLASGFASGPNKQRFDVRRTSPAACEQVLRDGEADVALLPTLSALRNANDFDVLPGVALSSWSYPFARLVLDHGLEERLRRVAFNPQFEQEAFLARLTLREHYKLEPEFVSMPDSAVADIFEADTDGHLIVGPDVPTMYFENLTLDLGQEWFELAQYPMCWGLFACLKGGAGEDVIRSVISAARVSEQHRHIWIRARETSQDLHSFYAEDLRLRLDDLVVASLTELRQYLFYYDILEDVRDIPFVFLADGDEEEGQNGGGASLI